MGMGGTKAIMVVMIALAMIMCVVVIMAMGMRMGMLLARILAMGMAVGVMIELLMIPRIWGLIQIQVLDTGLALTAAAHSTHLLHLQFFDSQFFATGDAHAISAT